MYRVISMNVGLLQHLWEEGLQAEGKNSKNFARLAFMTGDETLRTRSVYRLTAYERLKKKKKMMMIVCLCVCKEAVFIQ